jgi:PIN domain nuclease of toxin-antitoxin system
VILIDTHVAIWIATDNQALGDQSRALAERALSERQIAVSAITFWEIALLVAKRRFEISKSADTLRGELLDSGVIEVPLTGDIAILAVELDNLHGDPADRFIAATAIAHDAILMTADVRLLRWRHKVRRQDAAR